MYLNIGIFLFNFKFYQFFWWIKFIFCDRFLLHYISIYCCAALHKWNISNTNLICIHYIFLKYLKVSLPKIYFMLTWIFIVRTLFLICWKFSSSYLLVFLSRGWRSTKIVFPPGCSSFFFVHSINSKYQHGNCSIHHTPNIYMSYLCFTFY